MPYPNSSANVIVISQTSGSAVGGQYPFIERQISGSNLFLVTDASGNLTGSTSIPGGSFTSLTVTGALTASIISASTAITSAAITSGPITASNISASGFVSASNLFVGTSLGVGSSVNIGQQLTVGALATFNGNISASGTITASGIFDTGPLTVLGNTILGDAGTDVVTISGSLNQSGSYFVNGSITASNISASGTITATTFSGTASWATNAISASNLVAGNTYTVAGLNTTGTVSASVVSASNLFVGTSLGVGSSVTIGQQLTVGSIATFNGTVSASSGLTASAIRVVNSIVDGGTLTVNGNTALGDATTDIVTISGSLNQTGSYFITGNITASGTISSSNLTSSNISVSNSLIYRESMSTGSLNADIYLSASAITSSNIVALIESSVATGSSYALVLNATSSTGGVAYALSASAGIIVGTVFSGSTFSGSGFSGSITGQTLTMTGNSVLGSLTASSISASGNISGSNGWFNNLTVAGTLNATVSGSITNANSASIATNNSTATLQYITFVDGTGTRPLYVDQDSLTWQPSTNTLSSSGNIVAVNYTASRVTATGGAGSNTAVSGQSIITSNGIGVSGNSYFNGDVGIGTSLTVGGNISGSSAFWLNGNATLAGNSATVTHTGTGNLTISSTSGNVLVEGSTFNGNDLTVPGDVAINGGELTTTAATFNLLTGSATTVNFAQSATSVSIGATGSSVVLNGDLAINGGDLTTTASTFNLLSGNSSTTTVNMLFPGATPTLNIRSTKDATALGTAAVVIDGGVSIAKNLIVSGSTTLYGDVTMFGTGSIINISSSNLIIGDNRIQLNAWSVGGPQRYGGVDIFDSGSTAAVTSSILWDSFNNYWLLQTNSSGSPVTTSSAIILQGPTSSFGSEFLLTVNNFLKVQTTTGNMITSSLSEVGNTLQYAGTISASVVSGSTIFGATGSFVNLAILTGSAPNTGSQVPTSPSAAGLPGQIEVDNNFIYVYTNNLWKRTALNVWSA